MTTPSETIERLVALSERFGPVELSIAYRDSEWSVALMFGQEADDSPMWGGAAYGVGDDLKVALEQALAKAGA